MSLFFLIPLAVAIFSAYLSRKTTQEIAYLTGTITILSLLISLIIAPWQLQLVIVLIILIIARQLWQQLNALEQSSEVVVIDTNNPESNQGLESSTSQENSTEKKYRGLIYNSDSYLKKSWQIMANIPFSQECKYRGNPLKVKKLTADVIIKHKPHLKYRGIDIPEDKSN